MRETETGKNKSEDPAWNILIVDPGERSCLLLKSILIGSDCRVSISSDWTEASKKLDTGLFDAVFFDLKTAEERTRAVELLEEQPPEIPLAAGTISTDLESVQKNTEIAYRIEKPIRIREVRDVLEQMKSERRQIDQEREDAVRRSTIQCRIQLSNSDEEMNCYAISLNPGGLFTEPKQRDEEELIQFHNFFTQDEKASYRILFQAGNEQVSVPARPVFTERTPNEQIHGVGFRFEQNRSRIENKIQNICTTMAPEAHGETS